jgi:hypothetical protein
MQTLKTKKTTLHTRDEEQEIAVIFDLHLRESD